MFYYDVWFGADLINIHLEEPIGWDVKALARRKIGAQYFGVFGNRVLFFEIGVKKVKWKLSWSVGFDSTMVEILLVDR